MYGAMIWSFVHLLLLLLLQYSKDTYYTAVVFNPHVPNKASFCLSLFACSSVSFPSPHLRHQFSSSTTPPRRLSVTVVKNAATGQRTNNLIAAVWQEEQEEEQEEDTDSQTEAREGRERKEYKRVIEEPDVSMSSVTAELERGRREGEGEWGRREGEGERRGFGRAASWLRKIATRYSYVV